MPEAKMEVPDLEGADASLAAWHCPPDDHDGPENEDAGPTFEGGRSELSSVLSGKKRKACFTCGGEGHMARDCPNTRCHYCGNATATAQYI